MYRRITKQFVIHALRIEQNPATMRLAMFICSVVNLFLSKLEKKQSFLAMLNEDPSAVDALLFNCSTTIQSEIRTHSTLRTSLLVSLFVY